MTTAQTDLAVKQPTTIAPMSIKDTVIAQFKEAEKDLTDLADRYRNVVYDVTTPKGMKDAIAARADLRDNGRLMVTRAEKRIKADVNELKTVMSDEVERLVAIVKPVEEEVDKQIKAEEARKAAEKAERDRIEAERVGKHQANIDKLNSYVARAEGQPVEAIEKAITSLEALVIGPEWEEFATAAEAARTATVASLRKMVDSERQRLENERLQRELAEARAALQAQQAKAQAEAQAKADEEARQKAEADAREAQQRQQQEAAAAPAPAPAPDQPTAQAEEPQSAHVEVVKVEAPAVNSVTVRQTLVQDEAPAQDAPQQQAQRQQAEAAAPASSKTLTESEFKALIESGATLKLSDVNSRLGIVKADAGTLAAVGIQTAKERGAVHIAATDFRALCDGLIEHIQGVRDSY